jgi:excisionase family DNA binding protein
MSQHTAEAVYRELRKLPSDERTKFFQLLGEAGFKEENQSHEQVFGHLVGAEFTAAQAAEYLEVSMSTFRRYVQAGRIQACTRIGRSDMYATKDLKTFKRALREVKGA